MQEDIIVPIAGILTAVIIVSISIYTKYRIKVEQIKADAMVRAEEVRAKNQLELERLMQRDYSEKNNENFSTDESKVREKI
jgi:predicted Holliday junction resolvase-like endonuclease